MITILRGGEGLQDPLSKRKETRHTTFKIGQGFSYYCQFGTKFQSGKKGSKHLISCISMANKVIEYIEITQNTQVLKIAVFAPRFITAG